MQAMKGILLTAAPGKFPACTKGMQQLHYKQGLPVVDLAGMRCSRPHHIVQYRNKLVYVVAERYDSALKCKL